MKIDDENERKRRRSLLSGAKCIRARASSKNVRASFCFSSISRSLSKIHWQASSRGYIVHYVQGDKIFVGDFWMLDSECRNDYYKVWRVKISVDAYSSSYRLLKFASSEARWRQERGGDGVTEMERHDPTQTSIAC